MARTVSIPVFRLPKSRRLIGEALPECREVFEAIYDALAGRDIAADVFLDVLAGFASATITVHPSTRDELEEFFFDRLRRRLEEIGRGELH